VTVACPPVEAGPPPIVSLYRAGETLHGPLPAEPTWGWYSPTYAHKIPALAFVITIHTPPPTTLATTFHLLP